MNYYIINPSTIILSLVLLCNCSSDLNEAKTSTSQRFQIIEYNNQLVQIKNDACNLLKTRHYVFPNEWGSHSWQHFWPKSEAKALIAVGSFIPILDFTSGPFELLFLIDRDLMVYKFNTNHFALIISLAKLYPDNSSFQRLQYISSLLNKWLSEQELQEFQTKNGTIPEDQKMIGLLNNILRKSNFASSAMPSEIKAIINNLDEIRDYVHKEDTRDLDEVNLHAWLLHMSSFDAYWTQPAKWQKLVHAITHAKAGVVCGDFFTGIAMNSIKDAIISLGIHHIGLQLSNIPSWRGQTEVDQFISDYAKVAKLSSIAVAWVSFSDVAEKHNLVYYTPHSKATPRAASYFGAIR